MQSLIMTQFQKHSKEDVLRKKIFQNSQDYYKRFQFTSYYFFITLLDNHAFKTFSYAQCSNHELSSCVCSEVHSCVNSATELDFCTHHVHRV